MDAESCKDLLGVYFPYGDRYISTTGPVPAFTSNRYANSKLAPLIPFSVARDSAMPQGCVIELFTAENVGSRAIMATRQESGDTILGGTAID